MTTRIAISSAKFVHVIELLARWFALNDSERCLLGVINGRAMGILLFEMLLKCFTNRNVHKGLAFRVSWDG